MDDLEEALNTFKQNSDKYKLKLDLPGDRDLRSRLINCMGEEIQLALKNKQSEAFAEPEPDETETQQDLEKAEKAARDKAAKEKPAKGAKDTATVN